MDVAKPATKLCNPNVTRCQIARSQSEGDHFIFSATSVGLAGSCHLACLADGAGCFVGLGVMASGFDEGDADVASKPGRAPCSAT